MRETYLFESLNQVREVTERWLHAYNKIRLHDALGRPSRGLSKALEARTNSTNERSTSWGSLRLNHTNISDSMCRSELVGERRA